MARLPKVKLRAIPVFPSTAIGTTGIDVAKANGIFSINLDVSDFQISGVATADALTTYAISWGSVTTDNPGGSFQLVPYAGFQSASSELSSLAELGTLGLVARIGTASYVTRTVAPGTGIGVTNADGIAGNPTVAINDAELLALAGVTSAADRLFYFTGSGTGALATFTTFGRSLVDDADAATARTTLGLSSVATATPAALTKTDDTNVTLTLGGTPATALLQAASITVGWTGTLGTSRGGFGADVSASSGVPLFAAGVATFTGTTGTGNFVRATSPTLVTPALGTPSAAVLTNATGLPLSTGISGTGTGVLAALAINVGSAGAFVTFNGAGGTPSSLTLTNASGFPLATGGTGQVPLANGGTAANLTASNGGILYSTATAGAILAGTATVRQMLQSGASSAPTWSTATWPSTTTLNQILYSSSANTVAGLATATNAILVTSGGGSPSLGTAVPNGVTGTTQAVDDSTAKLATDAFVLNQAASATPLIDGAATVGTSTRFARGDHVHPTDTTRAPLASPALTGTPTAPTAAVDTNTTQLATTAMVLAQAASATPLIDGVAAVGTSTRYARGDHVHPTDTTRQALLTAGQLPGTATNDSASVGNVGEIRQSNALNSSAAATITIASPGVVTWTGSHGLSTDGLSPINFTTSGALPTGLVVGTIYWTVPGTVTATTFQLATSIANAIAGTAINTSGSQSGSHIALSVFALATSTNANYCALSLPAGDWDVTGTFGLAVGATTNITGLAGSLSTTSATLDQTPGKVVITLFGASGIVPGNSASQQFVLPTTRLPLSATTTVYAVANVAFTVSTASVYGSLRARRAR